MGAFEDDGQPQMLALAHSPRLQALGQPVGPELYRLRICCGRTLGLRLAYAGVCARVCGGGAGKLIFTRPFLDSKVCASVIHLVLLRQSSLGVLLLLLFKYSNIK